MLIASTIIAEIIYIKAIITAGKDSTKTNLVLSSLSLFIAIFLSFFSFSWK
jgi:hypothetical protein